MSIVNTESDPPLVEALDEVMAELQRLFPNRVPPGLVDPLHHLHRAIAENFRERCQEHKETIALMREVRALRSPLQQHDRGSRFN